jgi:anaphase-promoting complex subunit 6
MSARTLSCRAHKLVEEYPSSALAWFGVGCYYMASRQYEQARRFFAKATQLDKHNAHAWIGFGHAFAEQVGVPGPAQLSQYADW